MSPRRSWPLALRLVAGVTALTAVVLVVSGLTVTAALRHFLFDRLDQQVVSLSESAQAIVHRPDVPNDPDERAAASLPSGALVVLFGADGTVLNSAAARGAVKVPPSEVVATTVGQVPKVPFTADLGGESYRITFDADHVDAHTVVAMPLDPVQGTIDRLILVELLVSGLALLALASGSYAFVRSQVRPLRRMSEEARRIARTELIGPVATDSGPLLAMRLPEADGATEVQDLSESLHAMLGHIDSSMAARAAAEDRLRQFVADASHELRTPLASIRGYAELSRRGMLPDAQSTSMAAQRIEDEAARMSVLVDDLLLLARLDQGRPLNRDRVDLVRLADDACADLRAVDPSRPVTLDLAGDDDEVQEVAVLGDADRLRQVLANLLANAVHHTPAGTAVEVRVRPHGTRAVMEVRDHGPGIAVADQARVFERFYRVDPGRSRDQGGSGLGLSIVRSVVKAHDGEVTLRSDASGTVVSVELPAAPV